jgi:hypothetical protein
VLGEAWTRGAKRSEVHAGMGRRISAPVQCWLAEPAGRYDVAYSVTSAHFDSIHLATVRWQSAVTR